MKLIIPAHGRDTDVLGLDVAMGHTLLFEVAHCFDQVFAETFRQLGEWLVRHSGGERR